MAKRATARDITPALLTRAEAAQYLGVAVATLDKWAVTGRYGLPMVRVGTAVRYRTADLDKWIESRTVNTTGEGQQLDR